MNVHELGLLRYGVYAPHRPDATSVIVIAVLIEREELRTFYRRVEVRPKSQRVLVKTPDEGIQIRMPRLNQRKPGLVWPR